jgi:hypothetical protein
VKIHKQNYPIRPIVSGIDSPCYHVAINLVPILNPLVGKASSFIKNSADFINKVTKQHVPPGAILASLDVVNLVTTTPTEKALEVLRQNLEKDSTLKERTHHNRYYFETCDSMCELHIFSIWKKFL